jgi:hypothetical protein
MKKSAQKFHADGPWFDTTIGIIVPVESPANGAISDGAT